MTISSPALLEDEIRDCEEKEVPFLYTVPPDRGSRQGLEGTVPASRPAKLSQGQSSHIQACFLLSWTSASHLPHMSCFPPPTERALRTPLPGLSLLDHDTSFWDQSEQPPLPIPPRKRTLRCPEGHLSHQGLPSALVSLRRLGSCPKCNSGTS